ncbi:hypothetical protein BCR33DRAFT_721601, partial [Rhizoclosmatium globosum]
MPSKLPTGRPLACALADALLQFLKREQFPPQSVARVFGMAHPRDSDLVNQHTPPQTSRPMGGLDTPTLVFRVWLSINFMNRFSAAYIADSLEEGDFPTYFEHLVCSLPSDTHYTTELKARGFQSIEWDIYLLQQCARVPMSVPLNIQKLKNGYDSNFTSQKWVEPKQGWHQFAFMGFGLLFFVAFAFMILI